MTLRKGAREMNKQDDQENRKAESRTPHLREKLDRCLEIAINRKDLSCHVPNIVLSLAETIKDPNYESTMMDVWCDYFLLKNEPKPRGTTKLCLACPRCGNSNWFRRERDDPEWECASCGELVNPEDMGTEAVDA